MRKTWMIIVWFLYLLYMSALSRLSTFDYPLTESTNIPSNHPSNRPPKSCRVRVGVAPKYATEQRLLKRVEPSGQVVGKRALLGVLIV
jgi:hypothetical protein